MLYTDGKPENENERRRMSIFSGQERKILRKRICLDTYV